MQNPGLGFDSIGDTVEGYFKIYGLKQTGQLTIEMQDHLIAEVQKGKTVMQALQELNNSMLVELLRKIEEENFND